MQIVKSAVSVLGSIVLYAFLATISVFLVPAFCVLRVADELNRLRRGRVQLKGSVVVVTGATGGFGTEIVRKLAAKGATIYAVDIMPLSHIEEKFADLKPLVIPLSCDVTSPDGLADISRTIRKNQHRVYALVNNAGINGDICSTIESSDANLRRVFEVNLFAAANLSRELHGVMIHGLQNQTDQAPTRGRIVNVTSAAGLVSAPAIGTYSATKFALEAFSDAMRVELHQRIDVAIIEPHFADTGILNGILNTDIEVLKKSLMADQLLKARARVADWRSGKQKGIMTPEYVASYMLSALEDIAVKDRYLVTPNVIVDGVMRTLAHLPNYFLLVDRVKRFMGDRNGF
jgi:NAD(P)-dependent dehydrogenase (short-subunit alcohol dehydrogenase family)